MEKAVLDVLSDPNLIPRTGRPTDRTDRLLQASRIQRVQVSSFGSQFRAFWVASTASNTPSLLTANSAIKNYFLGWSNSYYHDNYSGAQSREICGSMAKLEIITHLQNKVRCSKLRNHEPDQCDIF